jgi:hypothetical protein
VSAEPRELAPGLWRWTGRHPEWHPGEFGREVASYALRCDRDALLVDPLLPPEPEPVLALLDSLASRRLSTLITIPYHVRHAEALWRRYGAEIWGHPAAAKRLDDASGFRAIEPGTPLPAGVTAHTIGRPRRYEQPLHLPSHDALAFGDAVVSVDGELRVWAMEPVDERRARFYAERFVPTLQPLLDLDPKRILVTHGAAVLADGRTALQRALEKPPWYHRG